MLYNSLRRSNIERSATGPDQAGDGAIAVSEQLVYFKFTHKVCYMVNSVHFNFELIRAISIAMVAK